MSLMRFGGRLHLVRAATRDDGRSVYSLSARGPYVFVILARTIAVTYAI